MSDLLAWVDIETTGLDPISDSLLEVGLAITSTDLRMVASTSVVISPRLRRLDEAEEVVRKMHMRSGLQDAEGTPLWEAERMLVYWLAAKVEAGKSPMCGSSVHFDRAFLKVHMPRLEALFHYRNIDVSSVMELCRRWYPDRFVRPAALGTHRALPDLMDSITALQTLRTHYFQPPST